MKTNRKSLIFALLLFMTSFRMFNAQICDPKNQLPLINREGFMTTSTSNGASGAATVDTSVNGGDVWQATAAGQYIDIDLKQNYPLTGLVYVPAGPGAQVSSYSVQVRADGTTNINANWTTVIASNTAMPQMTVRADGSLVREPRYLGFANGINNARYIRFIVNNGGNSNIAELIPMICNTEANLVLECNNINKLNSGTNFATTGVRGNQTLDLLWTAVRKNNTIPWGSAGNTTTENQFNYNSITNDVFVPASIIDNAAPLSWVNSPFGNAKWISFSPNGNDRGGGVGNTLTDTFFFKARFMIDDQAFLDDLRLKLDFYADNFVFAVYVNGIKQEGLDNIPGANFSAEGRANTTIKNTNFTLGVNELIIQVVSHGGVNGLLVQNIANCGGRDYGDAPVSYDEIAPGVLNPAYHRVSLNANPSAPVPSQRYVSRLGGADIDYEDGPSSSLLADGDDQINASAGRIDDENIAGMPTVLTSLALNDFTIPTVTTNLSGHNTRTRVWLDINQNGKFDPEELKTVLGITTGSVNENGSVTYSGTILGSSKYLYGRIRTSTDPDFFNSPSPQGYGGDGEVEDFVIIINSGSVSGNVYLDPNGGTISGAGTNVSGQLYVNLIKNGIVVATQAVAADGSYSFTDIPVGATTAQLTTQQGVIGNAKPATILPSNLGYSAEGTGTGDGTANGEYTFTIENGVNTVSNFAIQDTTDSDGDGVIDSVDLDDDNDGILDSVECQPISGKIGSFGAPIEEVSLHNIYKQTVKDLVITHTTDVPDGLWTWNFLATGPSQLYADNTPVNYVYPDLGVKQIINFSKSVGVVVGIIDTDQAGEVSTIEVFDENGNAIPNLKNYRQTSYEGTSGTYPNGVPTVFNNLGNDVIVTEVSPTTLQVSRGDVQNSQYDLNTDVMVLLDLSAFKISRIEFKNTGTNGWPAVFIDKITNACADSDGDGIPDYLDLDSDNDGCVDAIEGGDKVLASDLVSAGGNLSVGIGSSATNQNLCSSSSCVDSNGVPVKVNVGGSADYNNALGQGVGLSQDSEVSECVDTDADGIPDYMDLDDDNDGILDNTECGNINSFADFTNATFTGAATSDTTISDISFASANVTGIFTRILDPVDGASIYTPWVQQTNMEMTDANVYAPAMPGLQNAINENITGFKGKTTVANYTLTLSRPVKSVTMHFRSFDYMKTKFTGNHKETLLKGGRELEYNPSTRELYDRDPITVENIPRDGNGSIRITSVDGQPFTTINFIKFDDHASVINSERYMITFSIDDTECDLDNDGIPNHLDLDSDNDGCVDALEGDENVQFSQLVNAGGALSVGNGSTASNLNLCAASCVDTYGVPTIVNLGGTADVGGDMGQGFGDSLNASIADCNQVCYKPGITAGTVLSTQHGITSLSRAGADNGNWPMVRKGAWTVLEAKTKGFVPNRLTNTEITALDETKLVAGMMVYNTTLHCIQINVDGTKNGWKCFNTQSCPD